MPWYTATANGKSLLPDKIQLSPVVASLLDDPTTSPSERRTMAIFHGQWDHLERVDELHVAEQAAIAWGRYQLSHPSLRDPAAPAMLRARAALARGEPHTVIQLLKGEASAQAAVLLAEAYGLLGQWKLATQALSSWPQQLSQAPIDDAAELTAATQALVALAQLEGRPARDFQLATSLFGKARSELDRLYWPALVAEAQLLFDKDNTLEAVRAITEAMKLNPQSSHGWYLLGRIALRGYNFDATDRYVAELRHINPQHLLADLLEAEMRLTQKDVAAAVTVIRATLKRHPHHPTLLAMQAAAEAMAYRDDQAEILLDQYHNRFPGSALAHHTVGRFLSLARQYPTGDAMLRRAIVLAPHWPLPQIELGLLLMQAGHEDQALEVLGQAARLDPFNRRANNQLTLARQLQDYEQIRTKHFLIRYRPGIDKALARDMARTLEQIYDRVTSVYRYQPPNPTLIEILPNERDFGVRITGLPDIWTIAACTGDVIALTPPRTGAKQRGEFDWPRVIEHEFVHTVTLNLTHYRIPHWVTEACAVWQEPGQRAYEQCQLLAWALTTDHLFELDQINWAFVRPRTKRDRPLAYAQASWMLEYFIQRFGHSRFLQWLSIFRDGESDPNALEQITGQTTDQFMTDFKRWATAQTQSWGLGPPLNDPRIEAVLTSEQASVDAIDQALLTQLLEEYPDYPPLQKAAAQIAIRSAQADEAIRAVQHYASLCPVDPWSDRQLVDLAWQTENLQLAVASLEALDAQDTQSGQWAWQLATIHRQSNRLADAAAAIERALHRQPYHADYRELAATIYLQLRDHDAALHHLEALAIIEPQRSIHRVRLAAIYHRMGQSDRADAAAREALKLDPNAPTDRFLK